MQTTIRVLLTAIVVSCACFIGYDMAHYYLYSPWTRDARVRAEVVTVAPDVSGYVADMRVRNDQLVKKGDLLFVVDQERYRLPPPRPGTTGAPPFAQYHKMAGQI